MKKINSFQKLRFFFRRQITLSDFSESQQDFIFFLCRQAGICPEDVVFKRTFNNSLFGDYFEFIGFFPVFSCREIGFCYFSAANEID